MTDFSYLVRLAGDTNFSWILRMVFSGVDELAYIQRSGYGGTGEAPWGRSPLWGIPQNSMDTLGFEPSLQAEGRVRIPDTESGWIVGDRTKGTVPDPNGSRSPFAV